MADFNGKKGRWVTIEGRHIFIADGQSIDEAVKKAFGMDKEDPEDRKEKQIEHNKKEAAERNEKDYTIVHPHPSKTEKLPEIKPKKLSKEDLQKLVEKHKNDKDTDNTDKAKGSIANIKSIYFKNPSKEGVLPNGDFQMADGRIAKPAPEGTTSNENGKYFSPDGKHWYEDPKSDNDKPWWGDNPPAPKLIKTDNKKSDEPDENGLYDITDSYYPKTTFGDDLFNPKKLYLQDRTTRFVAGLGDNAQQALGVLGKNAQGIFIDCPHDTTVTFTDTKGRVVSAKARIDNQGRVSWTIRRDNVRSGSGWSSRDLAEMLSANPKDFSMHIPMSDWNNQPDVQIDIKDGKVSKSVKSSKKPKPRSNSNVWNSSWLH